MAGEALIGAAVLGGLGLTAFVIYEVTRPATTPTTTTTTTTTRPAPPPPPTIKGTDVYPTVDAQSFIVYPGEQLRFHYGMNSGFTDVNLAAENDTLIPPSAAQEAVQAAGAAITWGNPTVVTNPGGGAVKTWVVPNVDTNAAYTFRFEGNPQAIGTIGDVTITITNPNQ